MNFHRGIPAPQSLSGVSSGDVVPAGGEDWRGEAPPNQIQEDESRQSYKPISKPFAKDYLYKKHYARGFYTPHPLPKALQILFAVANRIS